LALLLLLLLLLVGLEKNGPDAEKVIVPFFGPRFGPISGWPCFGPFRRVVHLFFPLHFRDRFQGKDHIFDALGVFILFSALDRVLAPERGAALPGFAYSCAVVGCRTRGLNLGADPEEARDQAPSTGAGEAGLSR